MNTRLDFYTDMYKHQFQDYFLPEDQIKYTAHPLDAIKTCEEDKNRYSIILTDHDYAIGFFVLHGWEGVKDYSDNKRALLLRAYSINSAFQGKGFAKKSLQLLPSFVKKHFPEINEIILAVNEKNTIAQHVYKQSGFIDHGIRKMGSKGLLLILHYDLT